jgi:hypothetical protein
MYDEGKFVPPTDVSAPKQTNVALKKKKAVLCM